MMVDEFTLLKCIGKGAFGEVYLSSKQGSSSLFAIKKVPKSKADSPAIKKYFINEIQILREISHPHIIHFETIKHTIHNYYIVTEYCNGGDLFSCLKKYQKLYYYPFTEEIVQHLMRQIVSAIKYLHSKRILHRDLKLENILVNFENDNDKANVNMLKAKIKIIDFGFATHLGASNLRYSTLGSPINMDPLLLKKLANKHNASFNLIGYDEKADIWSLGTVCYELLIGHEIFNAQTMIDLIRKVENGNYHVPTNISKEFVSFLNGMLQYSAKNRLSADELSKHAFLTKNVKDFKKLDLRKVSHKIDNQGLNINIKRNQSIWAIFNEEDEKTLIDIPGKYLVESPIQELEELLGIKNIVNENNNSNNGQNPFAKPVNINININNNTNKNIDNNQTNSIQKGENNIDYNLLKKQQKMYREINLQNDKNKRYANYVYNNANGYGNKNNYYYNANLQPKYYNTYLNGENNIVVKNKRPTTPINNNHNTGNNVISPASQNNKVLYQYPKYQNQNQHQNQYHYINQSPYYQTNIQNIQNAPVKSNQDLINQGFYQTSPTTNTNININNINNINTNTNTIINNNNLNIPSGNVQTIQNITVKKLDASPSDNNRRKRAQKDEMKMSKISGITNITTRTYQIPKGTRMPKSYYDNYNNNPHSKSPIRQQNLMDKNIIYQKQKTFSDKTHENYYMNNNNQNNTYINIHPVQAFDYHSTKEIKNNNIINNMNNYQKNEKNIPKDRTVQININHNKERKGSEPYTIKYENENFPIAKDYTPPKIKITKIEEPKDKYPIPSDFSNQHKNSADNTIKSIHSKKKENNNIINKNNKNKNKDNNSFKRDDSFPMPESEEEEEKEKSNNDSKNDDDSENLDDLIDFKLGEEICPEPEDEKSNDLNDNNDKEKEDNFEMTMKQKIMERTVERPTIGVPPPGTNPNDNYDYEDDDSDNNGVFQTNKNNVFTSDDINFEL